MIFLLRFLRHVTFGARPFSPSGNTKTVPRKLQGNIHTHTHTHKWSGKIIGSKILAWNYKIEIYKYLTKSLKWVKRIQNEGNSTYFQNRLELTYFKGIGMICALK